MRFSANSRGIRNFARQMERNARTFDRDVQNVVRQHGGQMQRKMVRNAVFTQGYATGTTRRSISLTLSNDGMRAVVAPGTFYSVYLLYGTRYMASQDFRTPALISEAPAFLASLERLVR